ncbi:DMSO/selenate family reductase complex A subunit [uncultured Ferrimonas sp.]|uniref:DMSO/selenate family reductase complex A subunit n=1 Tax=uncultured Ferrimonas sp. TaxID=432640 RepID=UPI00262FDD54|nr:DMSO/selenate family reductase complex A subunit [uncultured Ferrimonas sp.]
MQRRDFLKLSATAGAVSCITACGSKSADTPAPVIEAPEQVNWSACLVNCGANCPVRVFSRDGIITRVETDGSGSDAYGDHQVRACVRGRSLRQRTYAADRLKTPLKRKPGTKRGAGQWEEISWEQAFAEIGQKTTELRSDFGNEAIYMHYGSGAYYTFAHANCIRRALALSGGYLGYYSNYSWAALREAAPATYGSTGGTKGSSLSQVKHSDVFVGIGYNPFEMRMSGAGEQADFLNALLDENGNKRSDLDITIIDPRYTDTNLGKENRWLPIRPGTDAALAEAIAYQMINSGWVAANSKAWIDQHCIGYDQASLEQAKLDNPDYADVIDVQENYYDHIMGVGKFTTAKTPAWAAAITGIPAQQIIDLADRIMGANAPFIITGAGPNRQANGEQTMRATYMLNILTGKIGNPGVTNGELPTNQSVYPGRMGDGGNAIKPKICFFDWTEAVENGDKMSWESHGVTGLDDYEVNPSTGTKTLPSKIKAIFSASGNALINQHADVNKSRELLEDESQVELLVVVDCWMTSTAKMADYVLPDTSWLESDDITYDGYASGDSISQVYMSTAVEPMFNCRNMYQIGLELCKAMGGDEAAYTEGKTEAQWLQSFYDKAKAKFEGKGVTDLPATFAEAQKIGLKRAHVPVESSAIANPVKTAEGTPSGKIEIYSLKWAKAAQVRVPFNNSTEQVDQIEPLSKYVPTWEGFEATDGSAAQFPLQVVGYHTKGRVHSSYHNVEWLREAVEDCVWVNPADATGFENGQLVKLSSARGTIEVRLRKTPRVAPGVVGMAQGAWYLAEQLNGVDKGGCSNVLTKYHPAPYGRGNTQHTIRVKLEA